MSFNLPHFSPIYCGHVQVLKEMSAHGVIKAIASFYRHSRFDSDTVFERHRSLIPINNDIKEVDLL